MNRLLAAGLISLLVSAGAVRAAESSPALRDCDQADFAQTLLPAAESPAASAVWLNRTMIRWPGQALPGARYAIVHSASNQLQVVVGARVAGADGSLALEPSELALPAAVTDRFKHVAPGIQLAVPARAAGLSRQMMRELLRGQLLLVETDAQGLVQRRSALQHPGVLDDLYAADARLRDLGVTVNRSGHTAFKLWAPTARQVSLCLYGTSTGRAGRLLPMQRGASTGVWKAALPRDLSGQYYTYLVDVFVPGVGRVRNRVTDPYALSLSADSWRSWIGRLDDPRWQPAGWAATPRPDRVTAATDLVIYELHVRDFSAQDQTVPAPHRGKYLAFTELQSDGMRHLQAMARSGLTDVHLLPVFDLATVPEQGCVTPVIRGDAPSEPDSETQQAASMAAAAQDCFNWGYDPFHFTAPEGSYATDAMDGAVRVLEFRRMVQALHRIGLRVGMDMVYNHTTASGQKARSVLDRIVPGYYQRLNAQGAVETSTCCDNTATEHLMMAKLMIDSAVVWARDYRIDSMRFDLMGHQPRAAMERLQAAVDQAAGRHIHLIGEGWNFGEVANGARFVQAAQGRLNGSGIATFSDRGRDAVRGGGCCDDAAATLTRQGWINGQFFDANSHAQQAGVGSLQDLQRSADLVRVGLAGSLQDYTMTTHEGKARALRDIDYAGQGAGYVSQPGEVVNYVENHDNPTLFDINVLKLPSGTSSADRARVQVLALATTALSQGIAYFHAGVEALRSKNMDRNSFDSGDWFNRLDWTFSDNHFGSGLPPRAENGSLWEVMKPLLRDPAIKPSAQDIRFTRDAFMDLLKIRASSTLFRLRTAAEVTQRLSFHNVGPTQVPTCIVGHLEGRGQAGAGFSEVLYAINVGKASTRLELPALKGRDFKLHPVHLAAGAADPRPRAQARWSAATGSLEVPPRTALVYVIE